MRPEFFTFFQTAEKLESNIWEITKLVVLLGLIFYLVFAVVVIRQVQLMTRTVTGELDHVVRVVAWVHFVIACSIFVLALMFL